MKKTTVMLGVAAMALSLSGLVGTRAAGYDWAGTTGYDWARATAGFDWAGAQQDGFDWAGAQQDGFDWAAPSQATSAPGDA